MLARGSDEPPWRFVGLHPQTLGRNWAENFPHYKYTAKTPEVLETSAENIMPDTGQVRTYRVFLKQQG